ncbi:Uncharacterised protein [Mycobacterium tuberculosis]|nr:Uncharacterised protein [Mycobacterium tuberculosis]
MDPGELQMVREVVRPKTPRGTETSTPSVPHTGPVPCRQTQNPERDGNHITPDQIGIGVFKSSDPKPREGTETGSRQTGSRRSSPVVRPKTPRGDGNRIALTGLALILVVVRPKTPRGDGNAYRPPHHSHATAPCPQTQNPERGRKPDAESHRVREVQQSSDPKPREGTETLMVGHGRARLSGSSDPKPREGTETGLR